MKHATTREVFEYWNRRRGRRRVPARSNIDPADIRHVLGDTFLLTADFAGDIRFRLAGTRICALFAPVDMSPGGMALVAPIGGQPGERVIAHVDHLGRLEGK